MKKTLIRILLLAMMICLAFSLVSCELPFDLPFDIPGITDGDDKDDDGANVDPYGGMEGLVLIYEGKAQFNVVYTSQSGGTGKRAATNFVKTLRNYNIEVNDPVSDLEADKVTECEIIIGANAANRGDECCITDKYLGKKGFTRKIVGKRVIIATGDENLISEQFDMFVKYDLKINSSTKTIGNLALPDDYGVETLTTYVIDSIKIGDVDFKEYTFINQSTGTDFKNQNITNFRNTLYNKSGVWLELGSIENKDSYAHSFIVRYVEDAGETGFRAYIDGADFIIECSYANAFNNAFLRFVTKYFYDKSDDVVIPATLSYTEDVTVAYYEDFGADGTDGTEDAGACDFEAIYNTHVYANQGGQKVLSKLGADANYYISATNFTKQIPIKTNVDFCGASFTVDDRGDAAFEYRGNHLFLLDRDNPVVTYNDLDGDKTVDDPRFSSVTIHEDDPYTDDDNEWTFDWLVGELEAKSLVVIYNTKHKDFVRHGSNQNSGNTRIDIFIVDVDGKVASNTPCAYGFDNITKIEIFRADDTEITVENGNFYNICCKTVMANIPKYAGGNTSIDEYYMCDYQAYSRGFKINRTNATMKNINHEMVDEPDLGDYSHVPSRYYDPEEDEINTAQYGSRRESYPYYGFFNIYNTYNFNAIDCNLTGHTTYYEDKPATASTGGVVPDPVAMGSYDLIVEYCSDIYLTNVDQVCATGIGDSRYWGIMSSNGAKNMFFTDCEINRFDAHRGFWNAELINTTIGHSFNVVGGGYLLADNVTKLVGNSFISLRGDYGATFRGDITLKDCNYPAYAGYNTSRGGTDTTTSDKNVVSSAIIINSGYSAENTGWNTTSVDGAYWQWDFGYTCYLPINVVVDNFQTKTGNIYLYKPLPNEVFAYAYDEENPGAYSNVTNVYQVTKSITYKNMVKDIPICSTSSSLYSTLNSIPITRENMGVGDEE